MRTRLSLMLAACGVFILGLAPLSPGEEGWSKAATGPLRKAIGQSLAEDSWRFVYDAAEHMRCLAGEGREARSGLCRIEGILRVYLSPRRRVAFDPERETWLDISKADWEVGGIETPLLAFRPSDLMQEALRLASTVEVQDRETTDYTSQPCRVWRLRASNKDCRRFAEPYLKNNPMHSDIPSGEWNFREASLEWMFWVSVEDGLIYGVERRLEVPLRASAGGPPASVSGGEDGGAVAVGDVEERISILIEGYEAGIELEVPPEVRRMLRR